MSTDKQLVLRGDYNYEDFLGLLIGAEELTGVLVVSGVFRRLKSILCVIHYIDGLNRLGYFDCVSKKRKCVELELIQAFGVLCDVPTLENADNL
ncbi:MAG: hypothetical protein PHQ00_00805 [Phycisphaerae bacterium]|nr:hypothetical protein [Phycisphaerae bacterium]